MREEGKAQTHETVKIEDHLDKLFLKLIFSFHPSKQLVQDKVYEIHVGKYKGFPAFFVSDTDIKHFD